MKVFGVFSKSAVIVAALLVSTSIPKLEKSTLVSFRLYVTSLVVVSGAVTANVGSIVKVCELVSCPGRTSILLISISIPKFVRATFPLKESP